MQVEWILDVLADLRAFAERNGLPRLAEELDDTRRRAALELSALDPNLGNETPEDGKGRGPGNRASGAANFDF
ncbi:MAG: hypothetical protein OEM24_01720 [Paracoccaceae bacterium]|nr:hypothetical protein [Paracoccaceae bacterium]